LQIAAGRGLYHHEDGFASHQVVGIPNARRLAIGKDEYVIQLLSSMKTRLGKEVFQQRIPNPVRCSIVILQLILPARQKSNDSLKGSDDSQTNATPFVQRFFKVSP